MRLRRQMRHRSVRVLETALANPRTLADAALPNETGGILLGHRRGQEVIVERFLEVPDEDATPTSYRRRHVEAQAALDALLAAEPPGSALGYVGEWHSHPGRAGASRRDVKQLRESADQTGAPVALMVLLADGRSWEPSAWIAIGRRTRRARVEPLSPPPAEGGERAGER